jgi:NitT/TauT family transport system substrate-binding protein
MPRLPRARAVHGPVRRSVRAVVAGLVVAMGLTLAACQPAARGAADATDQGPAERLRLGYFANLTHGPALVALARGSFAETLGDTALTTQVFSAGPAAVEALYAGAIDAAFIGPNPAINGFIQSEGQGLRIVAGTATGGAQLVVRPGIDSPEDLVGTTLASPQLGGTQDVALRTWLGEHGLETLVRGGGDVTITPTSNALAFQLFRDSSLDGAWLPESWASRFVLEAGGHVLVDEAELWPDGVFPTTYLVVSSRYLAEHPETITQLLGGLADTVAWMAAEPEEAATLINASLDELTGRPLRRDVLGRALDGVRFSLDPHAGLLDELRRDAVSAGTTADAPIAGIVDLRLLNRVLVDRGEATVSEAGLGQP